MPERRPARSQPPTTFRPHLRSALRELLTQPVRGWRLGALVAILAVAITGGAGLGHAAGVENEWALLVIQAALVVLLTGVVAVVVAAGRVRQARAMAASPPPPPARRAGKPRRR